jgi:tRNA(fMet)-specific endonuclease VapC
MLDTNTVSELIRHRAGRAAARARLAAEAVCLSVIVAAELRYGCARTGSRTLSARVEALLAEIRSLPFDVPADAAYGRIRAALEAAGTPIGGHDLLIAAHAISQGAIVVTANKRELERVPALPVEDWND